MLATIENIFSYDFLTNAFVACVLSGITCGVVGSYIVARRMVFLSSGITHASFGGLGIALYAGVNPLVRCHLRHCRLWVLSLHRAAVAFARTRP